ncbi:DUF99 family protein [Candidatus Bipolaricaulota bacterium]|nr:DUF99 family protein [Candidatus Bipolaricaulota bacterium]
MSDPKFPFKLAMFIKEQSKIIGWNEGPFDFRQEASVPLVGVITRGGEMIDGVLKTEVDVDGLNGTNLLSTAINESKHSEELNLVVLAGVTLAGFNVVDISKVSENTNLPVLSVTREKVDMESFKSALKNLTNFRQRWKAVKNAGEISEYKLEGHQIYYQTANLSAHEAERALEVTTTHSALPEPIRLAGIIATSLVRGES